VVREPDVQIGHHFQTGLSPYHFGVKSLPDRRARPWGFGFPNLWLRRSLWIVVFSVLVGERRVTGTLLHQADLSPTDGDCWPRRTFRRSVGKVGGGNACYSVPAGRIAVFVLLSIENDVFPFGFIADRFRCFSTSILPFGLFQQETNPEYIKVVPVNAENDEPQEGTKTMRGVISSLFGENRGYPRSFPALTPAIRITKYFMRPKPVSNAEKQTLKKIVSKY
jgi:hypothetical protein